MTILPSKKDFMINYRVQNIEGFVEKLKENGITILDDIAAYDYGKFVHIMDTEATRLNFGSLVENIIIKQKNPFQLEGIFVFIKIV